MTLNRDACSKQAQMLIDELVPTIKTEKYRPAKTAIKALAAIVADVLATANGHPDSYSYRSTQSKTFTGKRIGREGFRKALQGLRDAGYIERELGSTMYTFEAHRDDKASRFKATQLLIDRAAAYGIHHERLSRHFSPKREKRAGDVVRLRADRGVDWRTRPERGKRMSVDWNHPKVIDSKAKLDAINAFMADYEVTAITDEGGVKETCHTGFFRSYSQGDLPGFDYDKGGRIYSEGESYQGLASDDRKSIEINGEPTNEMDIRACQPAILHALEGVPFDTMTDPYAGIGTDRDIAKAFVMQLMGSDKIPAKWSIETVSDYAERTEGCCLNCDFPFNTVKDEVLKHFPLYAKWDASEVRWGDLQFHDGSFILDVIYRLVTEYAIPALPVHDSVIVRASDRVTAEKVMVEEFQRRFGVKPFIK